MSDVPDRDTEPCPDKALSFTLTQTCKHCGGLLGRTTGISEPTKRQIDAVLAEERDIMPGIILTWDSEVVSVSPTVH